MSKPQLCDAVKTAEVQRLFVSLAPSLRRFVYSLLPHGDDAEDVVQETFLTVTAKAADFTAGTNFRAWAFAIARLKVKEALRRNRRAQLLTDSVLETLAEEAVAEELEQTELASDVQRLALLRRCLKQLAPKSRTMIELQYLHGLKPGEIAERLAWTANAAYVALSRARAVLRKCVERQLAAAGATE